MQWTISELMKSPHVDFDENVEIDSSAFDKTTLINGVKDVNVRGTGFLDGTERFYVHVSVEGTMLCPDAVTGEEIEYPFDADSDEVYSFAENEEDEDVRLVTGDVIDLTPALIDLIYMTAPIQYTTADPADYPSGDGWQVLSEEEYEKQRSQEIDPRLAKLKEYRETED